MSEPTGTTRNPDEPPETLTEALDLAAASEAKLVFHLEDSRVELPFVELAERASVGAARLQELGVEPGDRVGIVGRNHPTWTVWAAATWRAGGVLVPFPTPLRVRDPAAYAEQVELVSTAADCRVVLADPELLRALPDGVGRSWQEPLSSGRPDPVSVAPTDPAGIQFTSGSTAAPKGVLYSQRALSQGSEGTRRILGTGGKDVIGGWAPFSFIGGLGMTIILPLLWRRDGHILPTERFAKDPASWFRLISEEGVTTSAGPLSAWYGTLQAVIGNPSGIDLTSLRHAIVGGEALDPDVLDHVVEEGHRIGLRPEALQASYGLTEILSGSATPPGEGIRVDTVDPDALAEGRAVPAPEGKGKRLASCGVPFPGAEFRIVLDGRDLPEREVGEIFARCPSMMEGYVGTDEDPFVDGWFPTGDLGYVADGHLYVSGRAKDMVIVMGRNVYLQDFEWAAGRVDGVRSDRCVAFEHPEQDEAVVVAVEAEAGADVEALPSRIRNAVANAVNVRPATVLVIQEGALEQTRSGKLARNTMREAFAAGRLTPLASL